MLPPSPSHPVNHTPNEVGKNIATIKEVVGHSGCRYLIQKILQEKTSPTQRVYLARYSSINLHVQIFLRQEPSAGDEAFILKDVPQSELKYLLNMYHVLRDNNTYLRVLRDTVPEQPMLVYKYFTGHLLKLVQKDLPIASTKQILKHTLLGLAALHEKNVVHTGKQGLSCAEDCQAMTDTT